MEFIKLILSIPAFGLVLFLFFQAGQGFYLSTVFTDAVAMASRLAVTHGRRGLIQQVGESLFENLDALNNELFVPANGGGFTFNQSFNFQTAQITGEALPLFEGFVANPRLRFQGAAGIYNNLHQNRGLSMTHFMAIFLANRYISSALPFLTYPCLENDRACFTCFIGIPAGCNPGQQEPVPRDFFTLTCQPQNLGFFFQFLQGLLGNPGGYSATFVRPLGLP